MATHLRDDTSIETAADVVDAIAAALEADPETAELAPSWTAIVTRGDGIAGQLRTARRVARRARSVVAVRDAIWDIVIKGFDRAALDYQQWWRSGTSAEVTRFGTDREVGFGEGVQIKFPGDPERVRSYLMATRRDTAGVPDAAPAPTPATPPPAT